MAVKTLSTEIKDIIKYPALPVTADSLDVPETAPDDTSGIDFVATGREIVIAHNTGGAPFTFTVVSVADAYGRTGDISAYSLGAGEFAKVPVPIAGFAGAGGKINVTVSNVAIKFLVLRAPNPL